MQSELDFLGVFVPKLAVWFVLSLALFVPVDTALARLGVYRLFWHAALARFALFVSLVCGSGLVASMQ